MTNEERDTVQLIKIANSDEQEERHPRAIWETNPSIISLGNSNIDSNIMINVFDEIYSNRTHRKCIYISYLTLLSMTLGITFWMFHWIAYNRCKNVKDDPKLELFLCDLSIVLETLTFILLGITPILFILMILFWIHYSCYNPIDSIRENKILLKIEGNQWEEQLNYYFNKKKCRYFNCFRRKQRKELKERKYGYIILSPHGIVIDFSPFSAYINRVGAADYEKLLFSVTKCFFSSQKYKKVERSRFLQKKYNFFKICQVFCFLLVASI
jgi:hypothetical protein